MFKKGDRVLFDSQGTMYEGILVSNVYRVFTEKDPSNLRVDDLIEICKVLNLDIREVFTKDIFNMGCRKWY